MSLHPRCSAFRCSLFLLPAKLLEGDFGFEPEGGAPPAQAVSTPLSSDGFSAVLQAENVTPGLYRMDVACKEPSIAAGAEKQSDEAGSRDAVLAAGSAPVSQPRCAASATGGLPYILFEGSRPAASAEAAIPGSEVNACQLNLSGGATSGITCHVARGLTLLDKNVSFAWLFESFHDGCGSKNVSGEAWEYGSSAGASIRVHTVQLTVKPISEREDESESGMLVEGDAVPSQDAVGSGKTCSNDRRAPMVVWLGRSAACGALAALIYAVKG